jgi:uncharacterized protein (DUF427 family)
MTVKYLHFTIEEMAHPETKEKVFEVAHWYYSTELPYVAIRHHIGFYENYMKADNAHHKNAMIDKFNEK